MNGRIRCAIYTRKSSEEGLEQSFNSLHAQREACEAYVNSQKHEGWQALNATYDDGGFSGGSTDRPGLKRLMADITAGKIDTVVVYKVDRLTRSLADFAKIVELFDSKQVSFVSVTQQFNTTTSMGRLTLNVLLSFAQFEREVTGERIRDKIAASKAKGMWMGGSIPLGYDLRDHKLHVNEDEAERVRGVYRHYLRLGCVSALKEYLDNSPIHSKQRTHGKGRLIGGGRFSRGALYHILRNHLYVGEVRHDGKIYKGQHEAIIEREVWLKTQEQLTENRQGMPLHIRSTSSSLLTGILFDEEGNRMTPTHANKAGKRYRYYASQSIIRKSDSPRSLTRIPAQDIEQAVLGRIQMFLSSDEDLLAVARDHGFLGRQLELFFDAARQQVAAWEVMTAEQRESLARLVLSKVALQQYRIEMTLEVASLLDFPWEVNTRSARPDCDVQPRVVTLNCPFQQSRRGQELRLIIDNAEPVLTVDSAALLKAIARARLWYEQIVSGEVGSIPELAKQQGITPRYVKKVLRLAMLGPDAVEASLAGEYFHGRTVEALARFVPAQWQDQKMLLQIDPL